MFQLSIEANIKPDMSTLIYTGKIYLMTRFWDITLSVNDSLLHIFVVMFYLFMASTES
jgi:hypothetical protein